MSKQPGHEIISDTESNKYNTPEATPQSMAARKIEARDTLSEGKYIKYEPILKGLFLK